MRSSTMFQTGASAPAEGTAAHQYLQAAAPHQRSPWHSPVPYLFGGLAAMLGLIAFSLLLLACSYWKLSLEGGNDDGDLEAGKPGSAGACKLPPLPPEQRIVVIMAGDDKPTFLATPVCSRASSFGDNNAGEGAGSEGGESKVEGQKAAAEPGNGTGRSHEHREEDDPHENLAGEAATRRRQDLLQAVEETRRSSDSSH